ncbi:hypothetical protein [Bradyrhizobium genosp. P]|uniref:hypothetical protein n=1 Tax=Bradyrhizobium genosp. P TaxID=83641 RepID=UPI003CEE0DA6
MTAGREPVGADADAVLRCSNPPVERGWVAGTVLALLGRAGVPSSKKEKPPPAAY